MLLLNLSCYTPRNVICILCSPGLYITGGLTPKNIDLIKDPKGPFLAAYRDKVGGQPGDLLDYQ